MPLESTEWQLPAPKAPPKKHTPAPIAWTEEANRIAVATRLMLSCMLKLLKYIENVFVFKIRMVV